MSVIFVRPVYNPAVRGLCGRPYPGHPRGCPNLNHKAGCPPQTPNLRDVIDLAGPCYLIISELNLAAHAARLGALHPGWSDRQRRCCLYWQGTARNRLETLIAAFLTTAPGYTVSRCPEALGLDVTATLRAAGGVIEWPPINVVRTIALAGWPLNGGPP